MSTKLFVVALCIGCLASAACNESTTSPSAQSKPKINDVRLLGPFLEYIPCERAVGVAWELDRHVPGARVELAVRYYAVGSNDVGAGSKRPAHERVDSETWELLDTQIIGNGLPGTGSCCWRVPAIECDQAVLVFSIKGAQAGNGSFTREFAVGEVRVQNRHQPPQQHLK